MQDFNITVGDICGDAIGLRVRVEDIDMYDYVHFSVIEPIEPAQEEASASGEMSHVAFVHRFTKVGHTMARRPAA